MQSTLWVSRSIERTMSSATGTVRFNTHIAYLRSHPDVPKERRHPLPQRFHSLDGHLEKSDSGIWMNGMDYSGISLITPHLPELNDSIAATCEEGSPLCGFPWILPVNYFYRKTWYLPAPAITPQNPIHFQLLSKEQTQWDSTKLTFEVIGSSHMALYLRLHQGSTLSTWSLGNGTPIVNSLNGDYFVYYAHGLHARPWHFWIELKVSLFFKHHIHGMVTLAIVNHYFFGEDQMSSQLHALLERFPNWIYPLSWTSTYDQFIF
uniref:Endoplasmic reticulum metallopeptidase 1-like C-terminal domain-containing protein n=1 Tax=Laticauda laticaudata TaxID=8630 RepID=A0A8C5S5F3_LATLA